MNLKPELIETERLILVPLSIAYASELYLNWLNDPDVNKYLETRGGYCIENLRDYVKNIEENKIFSWAICVKGGSTHIGNIKIDPINFKHGYAEYGIMLGDKNEWGKGYAYEASIAVLNYCFNILFLRKICLGVISENLDAIKLYNKLGFEVEGIYKKHLLYNEKYSDCIRMAIFNEKSF